tara:strand:+ start:22199 stop:23842 length:1644 start_codon:yes stop_codon:yes gene_type:complete
MPLGAFKVALLGSGAGGEGDFYLMCVDGDGWGNNSTYLDSGIGIDTTNEKIYHCSRGARTGASTYSTEYMEYGVLSNYKTAPTADSTNFTTAKYIKYSNAATPYMGMNGFADTPGQPPIMGFYGTPGGVNSGYSTLGYMKGDNDDYSTNFESDYIYMNSAGSGTTDHIYGNSTAAEGIIAINGDSSDWEIITVGNSTKWMAQNIGAGYYSALYWWGNKDDATIKSENFAGRNWCHVVPYGISMHDDMVYGWGYIAGIMSYSSGLIAKLDRTSGSAISSYPKHIYGPMHGNQYIYNTSNKTGTTDHFYVYQTDDNSGGTNSTYGSCFFVHELDGKGTGSNFDSAYEDTIGIYNTGPWEKFGGGRHTAISDSSNNHYLLMNIAHSVGWDRSALCIVKIDDSGTKLWERSIAFNGIDFTSGSPSTNGYSEWGGVKIDDSDVPIANFRFSSTGNHYRSGIIRIPTDGGDDWDSATSWTDTNSFSMKWETTNFWTGMGSGTWTATFQTASLTTDSTYVAVSNALTRSTSNGSSTVVNWDGDTTGNTFRGQSI